MWNIRSAVLADAALADGDGVDNAVDAAFGDGVADAALAAILLVSVRGAESPGLT